MKENMISLLAALLIIMVAMHEVRLMRKTVIRTYKGRLEKCALIIGVIIFGLIAIVYGSNIWHYLIMISGLVFIAANIYKTGIGEDTIIISARGQESFAFDEIDYVEITKGNPLKITFHMKHNSMIITQNYDNNLYDDIIGIFDKHHLECRIKHNSR